MFTRSSDSADPKPSTSNKELDERLAAEKLKKKIDTQKSELKKLMQQTAAADKDSSSALVKQIDDIITILSSNKEDGSLSEEAKKKITTKKDELKSFMQQKDNSAAAFIKQIEDILTDRLLQDFPLFQFKEATENSFAYWSILPLSRIWNRGCISNAPHQNKVYINIPDKRHYS
jgi:hypothetical protein